MGMFDEVRCQYPLPDPEVQTEVFQTKDFDCRLITYTITEDGQLLADTFDHHEVIEDPSFRFGFWLKRTNERTEEVPYHGEFNFYTSMGRDDWYEYRAHFTDGRLDWIKRVGRGL